MAVPWLRMATRRSSGATAGPPLAPWHVTVFLRWLGARAPLREGWRALAEDDDFVAASGARRWPPPATASEHRAGFDSGEDPGSHRHFIVRVRDGPLRRLCATPTSSGPADGIDRRRSLSWPEYATAAGSLHRDVKPGNLLIAGRPEYQDRRIRHREGRRQTESSGRLRWQPPRTSRPSRPGDEEGPARNLLVGVRLQF